ncbi:maleate cis-trans isomerase family protein [Roseovarius sp. E0-M6]|uniref:maleate cis-trans isomerase family protein n=1 Tax=Roseovarius sp. E0-M6 TaxID=3127118 RepID=UPI0030102698
MLNDIEPEERILYDDGPYPRGRIGFVCVANAGLTEGEMMRMAPPGLGLSFTHMPMRTECTVESLAGMEADLDATLAAFLPGRRDIDVLCYNCTAGSFVIGEEKIATKIGAHPSGAKPTTLLSGVNAAFDALGVRSIALGTAYTADINALERRYFEEAGIGIAALTGMGLMTDVEMNRVSPAYLRDFAISLDRPEADAIFLSCGALRSLEVVEEVEAATGKPMICSNQASFWHCLRLAGIDDRIAGFGQLLRNV